MSFALFLCIALKYRYQPRSPIFYGPFWPNTNLCAGCPAVWSAVFPGAPGPLVKPATTGHYAPYIFHTYRHRNLIHCAICRHTLYITGRYIVLHTLFIIIRSNNTSQTFNVKPSSKLLRVVTKFVSGIIKP